MREKNLMKIGMITHYMPPHNGGIERVAEQLAAAYRRRRYEVRWLASHDPAGTPRREGDQIRVPCWNGLERRLQVPLPLWGPEAWREVVRLARWADVLHVHDCLYPGSTLAALCSRFMGKPLLLSQHVGVREFGSTALNLLARTAYATLGRWVLKSASRLVFVTPAAEQMVSRLFGGYPRRARTIQNGVDTARFHPAAPQERMAARDRLGLVANRPTVLFVGRLVEQKGVPLLVRVMEASPGLQFLLVGDGPLAAQIPQAEHITWLRSVDPAQIHHCYQAADCLLLPAYGEGLPLVVQEAAASGLGILIADGESYSRPLLEQGACVAAARTPPAMGESLREIAAGHRPELGDRARRYAEQHWSFPSVIGRYVALLEELVPARHGQGVPVHES
jgi:glycosyltransferase involved in cell wall biosynthesis